MPAVTFYAVYTLATGEIQHAGAVEVQNLTLLPGAGEGVIAVGQPVAGPTDWVNAGLVEQRPGLADVPATRALAVDQDWTIPGIPDGTEVWVDGTLAATVDATGLTLSFPLAATWSLRLVPPFPSRPASCEVTVA